MAGMQDPKKGPQGTGTQQGTGKTQQDTGSELSDQDLQNIAGGSTGQQGTGMGGKQMGKSGTGGSGGTGTQGGGTMGKTQQGGQGGTCGTDQSGCT